MDQNNAPVVTFKEWMITILLMALPVVNIVMLFVWAFGGGASISKANFAKASLVWMAIGIVLSIILYATIFAALLAGYDAYY